MIKKREYLEGRGKLIANLRRTQEELETVATGGWLNEQNLRMDKNFDVHVKTDQAQVIYLCLFGLFCVSTCKLHHVSFLQYLLERDEKEPTYHNPGDISFSLSPRPKPAPAWITSHYICCHMCEYGMC